VPPLADLYGSILPRPLTDPEAGTPQEIAEATAVPREDPQGFTVGRVVLTPRIDARFVAAEGALETARPVEDRYYEIQPQVGAEAPVGNGSFRGAYRATIRRGSSFEIVESTTSHEADLGLHTEVGAIAEVGATAHFARGVLETSEVDPGREYFFQLGRYRRRLLGATARLLPGGRADLTLAASHDAIEVDEPAAFFDYERNELGAHLGYELGATVRATAGYSYTRIPFTAERPEAAATIQSASLGLHGEILPLTTGDLDFGYTRHESPNAAPAGRLFTGWTAAGRLEKSFTPATTLTVAGSRATNVSAFEDNGFYVSNAINVLLRAGLPAEFALRAGVGWHRNTYQTISALGGAPRRDGIRGWTIGLARPVTSHAFVRADYRHERRESNIDLFDTYVNALTVEVGLGLFGAEHTP